MEENSVEGLCEWLKNTKGITEIHIEELINYIPEYEQYLKDNEKGWLAEKVKCDLCGNEWVAVYHISSEKLECTNCGHMSMFETLE